MNMISRRHLLLAGAALAALAAIARPCAAVDLAELLKPPALGDMALGADEGAKVTVIEYASATCPHCAAFHKDVWPQFKTEYVDTKKIRFIFREFPTNDAALAAFMIARAAPKEAYFPMIDVFFDTLDTWVQNPREGLLNIAKQAGFTQAKFDETLKNEALAKGIMEIRNAGAKFGVKGTPTFFINGEHLRGRAHLRGIQESDRPAPLKGRLFWGQGLDDEIHTVEAFGIQVLRRADGPSDRARPHRRRRPQWLRQVEPARGAALGDGRKLLQVHARLGHG